MFSENSILKNIVTEEYSMHSCSIEWKHVFGISYVIMDIRAHNAENLSKYSMEKFHIIRIIDDNEHVESVTNISDISYDKKYKMMHFATKVTIKTLDKCINSHYLQIKAIKSYDNNGETGVLLELHI